MVFFVSNALAETRARIREKRYRKAVIIIVAETWVLTAAVPALIVVYVGAWRGFAYELSPFNEFSLMRFWLPFFGLSLLIPLAMVGMDFVIALAKAMLLAVRKGE